MSPRLTAQDGDAMRGCRWRCWPRSSIRTARRGSGPASAAEWNGYTWTGAGTLGSIAPIKHTSDLEIQEINFGSPASIPRSSRR
jgi:hypothetical protein